MNQQAPGGADKRLMFAAVLPLARTVSVSPEQILAAILERLEGTGAGAALMIVPEAIDKKPGFSFLPSSQNTDPPVIVNVNGIPLVIRVKSGKSYNKEALKRRVDPEIWGDGVKRLSKQKAHVTIFEPAPGHTADFDLCYDRAVAVTVTAAAIASLTEPLGILWHPAGTALPDAEIDLSLERLAGMVAPVHLWTRWREIPVENGAEPGVVSRGLYPLLGREIEILPSSLSFDSAVDFVRKLSELILASGRMPPHGARIEVSGGHAFTVERAAQGARTRTPVFQFTHL